MIWVEEMFATAGTVRSAIREKSGRVAAAPVAGIGPVTVGAGVAGACAAASSTARILPVITMPAARPQASSTTANTTRFMALSVDLNAPGGRVGILRACDSEHAVAEIGPDRLVVDGDWQVERAHEGAMPALDAMELLAGADVTR